MRFPLECFDAMRAAMPDELPLMVRFSGTDWRDDIGGWSTEDSVTFAIELEKRGCDAVDVSTGGNAKAEYPVAPGFQVPFAAAVKDQLRVDNAKFAGQTGDLSILKQLPIC